MRLARRKGRGDLPEDGVLVRLRGGSGIVFAKFEWKEQHDKEQIKTIITSNRKTNMQ